VRRNGRRWSQRHTKPVNRLTHRDWVMLRLLFYILSTDTSSVTVKDILWSENFITSLFGQDTVLKAFDLIRKDQIAIGAYDNHESWAMRRLRQNMGGYKSDEPCLDLKDSWRLVSKG
jgi:hypothetical protein